MRTKLRGGPRRVCRLLRREAPVMLCAVLLGLGASFFGRARYLPSLNGNLYAILATENSLFMVLSEADNNHLVRTDHSGTLLNYASTSTDQAFQDLEVAGDTVYAILEVFERGRERQLLVSLSLEDTPMRPRRLADLTALKGAGGDGVVWREIYLPPEGEASPALRLAGVDGVGRGYLLRWSLETGRADLERILEGETLLAVKYVAPGHYVWIDRDRRVGQAIGGIRQRDLLGGLAQTPCHLSTQGDRCFISDSVTGDIFEVFPDGTTALWRRGGDTVGSTGYLYRQLETFTTYPDGGGTLRVTGMCADGSRGVIAGEAHAFRALRVGALGARMVWRHGWRAALPVFCLLAVLVEVVRGIFRSPRLAVRLSLCEVAIAAILLGSVTAIQYRSLQQTALLDARQKLRLIGGDLAAALTWEDELDSGEIAQRVARLRLQIDAAMSEVERSYSVSVIWDTENGPAIEWDPALPAGYLVEDVKPRAYLAAVSEVLQEVVDTLRPIQSDTDRGWIYARRFTQGGRTGCVAVTQSERDLQIGQLQFFQRMLPILAACPLLFSALVWISRRLLRPLDEIKRALEEFYAEGGGNQMMLEGMPRTELYEVGRVFNQLSAQVRTQFNALSAINDAYARLAPGCLLELLGKRDVTELSPGEHAAVPGGLLVLVPGDAVEDAQALQRLARIAADQTAAHGGMLSDYDEGLSALTALFPDSAQTLACAKSALDEFDRAGRPVMAAVLSERVELGVFGGQRLLVALAVSPRGRRRRAVLALLSSFGAVLVESNAQRPGLRLLGWDERTAFFEDPTFRPASWQTQWRDARELWERALSQFRDQAFAQAARSFAQVLRVMPDDRAARWYLFRCAALRDADRRPDTDLLFDWGEREHG